MNIDYFPSMPGSNVQYQAPGVALIFHDDYTDSMGTDHDRSDVSNAPEIVQDICAVAFTDSVTSLKKLSFNTGGDNQCPILKIDKVITSLLDDFSSHAEEVKSFVNAIKNYNQTDGKGLFVELCELEDLKDEPDSIKTVLRSQTSIKLIDGKYTEVTEDVPVNVIVPHPVFKNGVDTGRTIQGPKIKKGKKISQANKDRLAVLRTIRDEI